MMVLGSGRDEPRARRHSCRKMTRISKISTFPQLEPFANVRNQIGFLKFKMPYGSFLDAIDKKAVKTGFHEVSFFGIFGWFSGFGP